MAYGIIEYDSTGLPKCELCGKYFARVLTHVRQKHGITSREYKLQHGFNLSKGIISEESKYKSQIAVQHYYTKVVSNNLIEKGIDTRFTTGSKGRTKEQVSEQTRIMLVERAKNTMSKDQRAKLGKKLGLSGKGNKARWDN